MPIGVHTIDAVRRRPYVIVQQGNRRVRHNEPVRHISNDVLVEGGAEIVAEDLINALRCGC